MTPRHLTLFGLLLTTMSFAGAEMPVVDVHVHLRDGDASLDAYRAQLKETGLDVTSIGAMWFGGPHQALAGKPDEIRERNDGLIELAATEPGLVPIATVHPHDGPAAVAELVRVAGHGVRVLKLHPHTQKFDIDDPRVLDLVRKAGELHVTVLIDNAGIVPGDCEKLFDLAITNQETNFIFAHMGGLDFRFWNILKAARTAEGLVGENIYFDISAIVAIVADSPIAEEFVWTMRNVGIDNILLGSDYPQYSLDANERALERLGLDETEKAKIRFENAQRLFGIPDQENPAGE